MKEYAIPRPTRTAVIDTGRTCNANCNFCYYAHQNQTGWVPYDELCKQADAAKERGNTLIDLTGGEPTIMPRIENFVDYIHSLGLRVCIITNALCGEKKINSLKDVGVDLFRISMHGLEKTHNRIVGVGDARQRQERFIEMISDMPFFHVNCVLTRDTQEDLAGFAEYLARLPGLTQFNVINFLPHYEWGEKSKCETIIADLEVAEQQLNRAIDILEKSDIGVNVRYYPMCRIRHDLRRTVCNDLQIMFDPWEWDYGIYPKTVETYTVAGRTISSRNEEKGEPCCRCNIHGICGGINRAYNRASSGAMAEPVSAAVPIYPYYYRQFNVKTLKMPWMGA